MSFLPSRPINGSLLAAVFSKRGRSRVAEAVEVDPIDPGALPPKFAEAANPRTTFSQGSIEVGPEAAANLDRQAAWLRAHPETGVILIASVGPERSDHARLRADAVRTALVLRGIAFARIRLTLVENIASDRTLGLTEMVLTEVSSARSRREAPLMLGRDMVVEGTARPRPLPKGLSNRPRRMVPRDIRPQRPTPDWARI